MKKLIAIVGALLMGVITSSANNNNRVDHDFGGNPDYKLVNCMEDGITLLPPNQRISEREMLREIAKECEPQTITRNSPWAGKWFNQKMGYPGPGGKTRLTKVTSFQMAVGTRVYVQRGTNIPAYLECANQIWPQGPVATTVTSSGYDEYCETETSSSWNWEWPQLPEIQFPPIRISWSDESGQCYEGDWSPRCNTPRRQVERVCRDDYRQPRRDGNITTINNTSTQITNIRKTDVNVNIDKSRRNVIVGRPGRGGSCEGGCGPSCPIHGSQSVPVGETNLVFDKEGNLVGEFTGEPIEGRGNNANASRSSSNSFASENKRSDRGSEQLVLNDQNSKALKAMGYEENSSKKGLLQSRRANRQEQSQDQGLTTASTASAKALATAPKDSQGPFAKLRENFSQPKGKGEAKNQEASRIGKSGVAAVGPTQGDDKATRFDRIRKASGQAAESRPGASSNNGVRGQGNKGGSENRFASLKARTRQNTPQQEARASAPKNKPLANWNGGGSSKKAPKIGGGNKKPAPTFRTPSRRPKMERPQTRPQQQENRRTERPAKKNKKN